MKSRIRGKERWNPTSREKRARCPDFLYAALNERHVCGFHRGKPHEAHQRQQTSQEIRGVGHPSFVRDRKGRGVSRLYCLAYWAETGRVIRSLRILYTRDVRFIPRRSAAPFRPPTTQLLASRARTM